MPDGSSAIETLDPPTPGARNRMERAGAPVVNEVLYHPISGDPGAEFIEISNPGSGAVPLAGWRLRGGIRYDFRPEEALAPGGYLVVARDPARLAALHGLAAGVVTGPFEGGLADAGDSIRLVDPRGVTARKFSYSDRDPWPRRADGQGSSLEIIHPALDPSLAASWAASDERSRAEWQTVR
jgi:Lamin Tail Domain